MKMNLNFLIVAVALTSLTGCLEVKGTLAVNEPIVLRDVEDYDADYEPGSYKGTVSVDSTKQDFIIDLGSSFFGGTKKYVFTNPQDASGKSKYSLNEIHDGEKMYLTAAESGQAYDLEAMYTEQERILSGVLTRTQPCSKLVKGQFAPGQQTIQYRKMSRTKTIVATLISPSSKKAVAKFSGKEVELEEDSIPTANDECK